MKKYLVIEVYGTESQYTSIEGRFDDERKAAMYCLLSKENNPSHEFYVAEMKAAIVK